MNETFGAPRERGWLARLFSHAWVRVLALVLAIPTAVAVLVAVFVLPRFLADRPVEYSAIEEHFKYGSTGGERVSGFPYWIFQAMPGVCPKLLPGGWPSLGFVYEEGKDLPVGMSKRNYQGVDRVFFNCAVCHTSTVRETPEGKAADRSRHARQYLQHLRLYAIRFRLCQGATLFGGICGG